MCGIIGVAGTITSALEESFKDLLILDSLRGEDSTGVAMVHSAGDISVVKEVGDPFILLGTKRFSNAFKSSHRVLIGHNRWATTGKVNRANAHPFECGDLIGVHNGTLRNKYQIPGHIHFDTDSESLYNHIDKVGIDEAMKIAEGAWALVYYNKLDHSVNMLRNDQRPLFFSYTKGKKALMWASEKWMLQVASSRNKVELDKIVDLPVDKWHKFSMPNGGVEIPSAVVETIKGKEVIEEKKAVGATHTVASTGNTTPFIGTKVSPVVTVEGVSLKCEVLNGKPISYCSMRIVGAPINSVEYRVYSTHSECQMFLEGEWSGRVVYGVSEGGVVKYQKLDLNSMMLVNKKRDVHGVPMSKAFFEKMHTTCANCTSKLEYDEDWVAISYSDVLCESCNTPQLIGLAKQVLSA